MGLTAFNHHNLNIIILSLGLTFGAKIPWGGIAKALQMNLFFRRGAFYRNLYMP